jgi:hypothetical protein
MSLKYAIDDLTDVDESLHSLYEQNGDTYILRVDGIPLPEDTTGLKSKVQQLMDEAKEAKRRTKELESQKQQQETETAQEKGEFKNLWEQAQTKLAEKDKELQEFTTKIQQKDINIAAHGIGSQLAKSDAKRAEVLADYASKYARHTGEKVQFLVGGMEIDAKGLMDHLSKEFPFLVDGSSATGGGAASSASSGATKSLNRVEFDKLDAPKKMQFVKGGGIISD